MLFSIYTRLDASSPLGSGCVSGSWFGTHHYPIACLGVLSTIGGRCRLYTLDSCSLRLFRTRVDSGVALSSSWNGFAVVNRRYWSLKSLSVTSIDVEACNPATLLSLLPFVLHLVTCLLRFCCAWSFKRSPEMADVEDFLRTVPASGPVLPEEVSSLQTTILVPQAVASSAVQEATSATQAMVSPVTDSVGWAGSGADLPSSPPADSSGNDSGGENSAADEPVEGNQGIGGASLLTKDSWKRMRRKCGFSREIETRLHSNEERPWSDPPGWICLYSQYFLHSRLWFPLPRLLTSYATKRDVAISQMSPAAIRNMVISLVLGAEVDVDVDAEFFEMISQMNFITGKTFSVSIKTLCRFMEGRGPSKADGWQRKYFFVRVSPASVADSSAVFRTEWNPEPVLHGKFRPLPSWATDRLNRILSPGRIAWVDFTAERVRRSIPRITTASRVITSSPSIVVESSKTKGGASAGGGSSSILTSAPVVIPPAAPNTDLSTAAIHSSLDKTTGGGDHLSKAGLSDPDAPTVSPLAAPTLSGALAVGGPRAANASERPSAGGSKKRKRTFVFEDPESPSLTPEDCARDLHSFRLSSSSLPDLEDMSFVQEYIEWASCEAQSKIKGNHLVGLFEGKCRRLSDDLEEERRLLAEERERLSAALLSLKTSEENSIKLEAESRDLRAEVAHLKESRAELAESERRRVESAMFARFGGFVEKVRKYLSDRNVIHPQILIESQLSGVVSCLKLFIEEGIPIPAAKLAENEQALSVHTTALNQMEVNELEMSDLPSFSFDADSVID
ncbi:hypothetical protein F2Q69_00011966 [Brassica cretica]|uniref:DUF1204 domain-containing protein n=1 Tax=Brassica cretica TaxID=69181 RepID=A0A8S9R7Q1_BRACR|nr:hypothetical protein F2Q69_00011966 [Brassica cretica]